MSLPSEEVPQINVIVLCGGLGKRMRDATKGRISKGQLPIALPGSAQWPETSETVLGMLVRALASSERIGEILLLTSDRWLAEHSELGKELTDRYEVNLVCQTDHSSGEEFPPLAVATLIRQIGKNVGSRLCTLIVNGDILLTPAAFHTFVGRITNEKCLIAVGVAENVPYLGMTFISPYLNWDTLTKEVGATNIYDLMQGLWQRVAVVSIEVDGPIYDCGSMEGYQKAYDAGCEGRLW
jgi:hypothetical protein